MPSGAHAHPADSGSPSSTTYAPRHGGCHPNTRHFCEAIDSRSWPPAAAMARRSSTMGYAYDDDQVVMSVTTDGASPALR